MHWGRCARTGAAARARVWLFTLLVAGATIVPGRALRAQQSCDDVNDCTTQDICATDGNCKGTPKAAGSPCTPLGSGDCAISGECTTIPFVGLICLPTQGKEPGSPCTIPGLTDQLGKCLLSAQCAEEGFCQPKIKTCPTPTSRCLEASCDPSTGECRTEPKSCNDACSTGQCNPDNGECINKQPSNEGQPCDDGKQCTTNDRCSNGTCSGSTTAAATATTTPTGMASPTPTASSTTTNTPPATATATPTSPPSHTPTATLTPTSTANPCVGDCGDDGIVTINNVVVGINIALDEAPLIDCPSFDANKDGQVRINELVTGVQNALVGCPTPPPTQTPTLTPTAPPPTSTATETPTGTATVTQTPTLTTTPTVLVSATPTPSSTPTLQATGTPTAMASATSSSSPTQSPEATTTPTVSGPSIPNRVAGFIETNTNALLVVPNILSALLGHVGGGLGSVSPIVIGPISFTCPGGGGDFSCSQELSGFPPTLGPPTYTINLSDCAVTGAGGTTLTVNGSIVATGQEGNSCFSIPSQITVNIPNLTVTSASTNGMTTATFTNVSGSVALGGQDDNCTYSSATFMLVGTMRVAFKDAEGTPVGSTDVTFGQGSSIVISVTQYGDDCVPTIYDTTVQGTISFNSNGNSTTETFTDYTLHNDASSGNNMIDVSGGIDSPCLGAAVQLATATDLLLLDGEPCPQAGAVTVMSGDTTDLVVYDGGAVAIDLGNNMSVDQTFQNCLNSTLFECPAS